MTSKRRYNITKAGLEHGYRSGLEEIIGDFLTSLGLEFSFESQVIRYEKPAKKSRYTPDFILIKLDGTELFIETKGRFLTADRQKHLQIKAQHPHLDIRFVFSNPNQRISKTSKTRYRDWCDKNEFLWAAKTIPAEWLAECNQ